VSELQGENELLSELEQACYRGLSNLALSKNDRFLLSKKLLKAKAISLAEKLRNLNVKKADQFFKALEDFSKFPDDKEIVSYLRVNVDKYGVFQNKPVLALPRAFESLDYLTEVESKYPAFIDFCGMIRANPDAIWPYEIKTIFWKMLGDPKNFKKEAK
jgi:hypothetical protein